MDQVKLKARDHSRSPMQVRFNQPGSELNSPSQWNSQQNGGFSTGTPWMRVNDDYVTCNAEQQQADPTSVFTYWSQILRLRRQYVDVLVYGSFELLAAEDPLVLCYRRHHASGVATVVLNFTGNEYGWQVPPTVAKSWAAGRQILRSYPQAAEIGSDGTARLKPFEALVLFEQHDCGGQHNRDENFTADGLREGYRIRLS